MVARSTIKLDENQTLNLRKLSYVGALISNWQVGVPPAEAQGVNSANNLFYKKVGSNILLLFL